MNNKQITTPSFCYKFTCALLFSLFTMALCAENLKYKEGHFVINETHDTILDLAAHTLIYDDTFSKHSTHLQIPIQEYKPLIGFSVSRFHTNVLNITQWLSFELHNTTSDSVTGFFFCGKHNLITLFDENAKRLQEGGYANYSDTTNTMSPTYYLPINVAPLQKKRFFVSIVNYGIVPSAIQSKLFIAKQNPILAMQQSPLYFCWLLVSCMVCGGILVLGMFNLVQYISTQKLEYLFYGCYAIAIFLSIERASEWGFNIRIISQFIPGYFFKCATMLNVLSAIFYLLFSRYFLDLKTRSIFANRFIDMALYVLVAGFFIMWFILLFKLSTPLVLVVFRTFSILPSICALILAISIFVSLRVSSPLLLYYYIGFLLLFMGVGVNVFVNNFARHLMNEKLPIILSLEIGVLLEMILFALGLGYKARLHEKQKTVVELENLKLVHQNEIELMEMRTRLSRNLHDDIGSTLSSINILSLTAQNNLKQKDDEKIKVSLEKINERSQRLLDNMRDIIWNISPGNDTVDEMMSHMHEYATTILEAKNIDYAFNFPDQQMDCKLTMKVKSNLYLIFKEAVNNLSKYSNATKVNLSLIFSEKEIQLTITDNGMGFNQHEIKHRGGLVNMQHRAQEMNGTLAIKSEINKGTQIELTMPRYG